MATALPLILILLVGAPAIYASDYTVGGSDGWDTGVDYTAWAAGEEFKIGDNLVFNYASNHKVDVVSEADYGNCATGNEIKSYTGGKTTIPITGPMYFICPVSNHCSQGQKLAINITVVTTTTPPTAATPPTTTTTPAGTTTSPPPPPPPPSAGSFCHMSPWMLGFSLLVAVVVMGFMG